MSKRSTPAGGYPQSEDDSSDHEKPAPKKPKPYQPPMLSTAGTSGRTFQFPAPGPLEWSSGRTQPKPATVSNPPPASTPKPLPAPKPAVKQPARATMPTPVETPATREGQRPTWNVPDSDNESLPDSPIASRRVENRPKTDVQGGPAPNGGTEGPSDLQARRRFFFEDKVNELGVVQEGVQRALEGFRGTLEGVRTSVDGLKESFNSFQTATQKHNEELLGGFKEFFTVFKNSPPVIAPAHPTEPPKAPKIEEDTKRPTPSHEELRALQDVLSER
ncbi:hypothetical protein FRC12_018938 [Ceratobasidium sp. 428]|nr:hypothetical protein FRC12_018938 [Ceratobasidium sp. 428]